MKQLGYLSIRVRNFEKVLSFSHEKLFMYFNKGKYSNLKKSRGRITCVPCRGNTKLRKSCLRKDMTFYINNKMYKKLLFKQL